MFGLQRGSDSHQCISSVEDLTFWKRLSVMKNTIYAQLAGYWNDIVLTVGLQIDPPLPSSALLNQAATTSLYQDSSWLKVKLISIRGFQYYIDLIAAHEWKALSQPVDPVTQLWDLFSYGVPLCYIFNKLQGYEKTHIQSFTQGKSRSMKGSMLLHSLWCSFECCCVYHSRSWTSHCCWDHISGNSIVKVCTIASVNCPYLPRCQAVKMVTELVECLPSDAFLKPSPISSWRSLLVDQESPANETTYAKIIREMAESERKFVHHLETVQVNKSVIVGFMPYSSEIRYHLVKWQDAR